nr:hypothetical protein [Tanacetum cinerariifolium]
MDNKKHIVNLESFREILHICPRLPGQSFVEPPFEEEILAFLWFLGHSGAIKRLTDVNINNLHQPWRSFAAIINKCLTEKRLGYDSLRLSQVQILWGLYHKRNVEFTYLMWEDFVYQVEHKDTKKSNEMYYPRDDHMCTIIELVSRHQNTQQFGAMLPIDLTNADIKNSDAYKEYYAVATRATSPKPKASVRKTRSSSDTTITPLTATAGPRLGSNDRGDDEGDDDDDGEEGNDEDDDAQHDDDQGDKGNDEDDQKEGSGDEQASDEEEFIYLSLSTHAEEETRDEESFDPIPKTPENTDDEGNRIESIFETTSQMDVQTPTLVAALPVSAPTLTPSTIATITTTQQAPTPPTTTPSTLLQDLPNFGSLFGFDHRLKTLEANFFQFTQTNQFAGAVSSIPEIVHRYMDQQMNETIDENMQKIIKEQVKEQVKTSYAVVADLSEMELKKILIEKMEGSKSIHRSNKQRNLYKALFEAYESDKIILDTYGDTITLKRRRDDDVDKDEEPSNGLDRGSKRRREGKEPESASAPKEKATRSAGKSTQGSKSRQNSASESTIAEEPMQTTFEMEEPSHPDDGILIDVRTALDDRLKGIRMKYLPQSIWRKSDKDRAATMI